MEVKKMLENNLKSFDLVGCEITDEDVSNVLDLVNNNGLSVEDAVREVLANIKSVLEL